MAATGQNSTRIEQTSAAALQATRDILDAIHLHRDDEQPIFDIILQSAARLCDAPLAGLTLANDARDRLMVKSVWGDLDQRLAAPEDGFAVDSDVFPARAFRAAEVLHIGDIRTVPEYVEGDPRYVALVEQHGFNAYLCVPLFMNGAPIGCLDLFRTTPTPFEDAQIALVETFATQAVIAIENARQFREVQERLERERASAEILQVISQSRDDERPVFDVILRNAARLCQLPSASLALVQESGTTFRFAAIWGKVTKAFDLGEEWPLDLPHPIPTSIRESRTVQVKDLSNTDLYEAGDDTVVRIVEQEGILARLSVPLISNGEAIGSIMLSREEAGGFTDAEITLIQTFAAQAVIAIENVRQFREVQERLERERASAEILEVISRSRGDEMPVFDVIVEAVSRLCDAPLAYLCVLNEERSHVTIPALTGARPEFAAALGRFNEPVESDWLFAIKSSVDCEVIRFDDLADSDLYRNGNEYRKKMVDEEGMRSVLSVPVEAGGVGYGCIVLYRREVAPFSDDDVDLVRGFAAQAVIAIENVRQFREVQERLEREEATKQILQVISGSRDDEAPVFTAILGQAARLCGAIRARLVLVDDDAQQFQVVGGWGKDAEAMPIGSRLEMHPDYLLTTAVRKKTSMNITDMRETKAYKEGLEIPVRNVNEGALSIMMVPLLDGDKAIGCIGMSNSYVGAYDDKDVALVESFAAQAVIAIENVRQFREVQERLEREEATGDVLGVISTSRDDEIPVFETILENASRLCKAPIAFLSLSANDGKDVIIPAHRGTRSEFGDILEGFSEPITRTELVAVRPVATGEMVLEDDIKDDEAYRSGDPRRLQMVDVEGARSVLAVPLIQSGTPIGAIVLYRREVAPFSDNDLSLVQAFAAQAVIAIENVRQFREVQERLEREAASAEILEIISQSRDNENPVFDAILENAARLCDTSLAQLHLIESCGERFRMAATWGEPLRAYGVGDSFPIMPQHAIGQSLRTGQTVHAPDLKNDEVYRSGEPYRLRLVDEEGLRSMLVVPLVNGDVCLGCIVLSRRKTEQFRASDIELATAFAAQAVIAIENVRQFREVQERLERETATGEVLSVISQSRSDDAPVFSVILENAARLCDAPFACLMMVNEQRTHVSIAAHAGAQTEFVNVVNNDPVPMDDDRLLTVRCIKEMRPVQVDDIRDRVYEEGQAQRTYAVDVEGMRTLLTVPLVQNGVGIGAFFLYRRHVERFSDDQINLLETFAAQAVIAIENVQQFTALETLNAELGDRVQDQVGEIERMGRLKRFLPSAVADAVVTTGDESMLSSHRALVATLFCDMRGFTAFCEAAEPEETIEVLQTYHQEMSELIDEYGGGVDQRAGDGIMVIFNDPIPVDDPAGDAVRLAVAMREKMRELCAGWKRLGHRLGFGVGISLGYATVGMVGSAGRFDYTASGTSVNTAARLCDMAADGEILISPRVWVAVEGDFQAESRGEVEMKGIREPVEVFAVG